MMHIRIVAVGKLKERFWAQACDEYLRRLRPYAHVEVAEVPDVDETKAGGAKQAAMREGEAILRALETMPDAFTILMDINGKPTSSEQIAARLEDLAVAGTNDVVFVIGGSNGVSADVAARVNVAISLGPITLPHNLARVVLLEQIYRAFKINRSEPYHK